jgi:hypothetical protein
MNFIRNNGEVVEVNDKNVNTLEKKPNYTVYGARHNPSGEQMVGVVYNNKITSQDEEYGEDEYYNVNVETNPKKTTSKITWRNLRLASAIQGQAAVLADEGGVGKALASSIGVVAKGARKLGSSIAAGGITNETSVRDDPLLFIASAEDWYAYIKNMNTVDIGAEFAAGVTHAQRSSNALFAHEWESDPGHNNLMGRLLPGSDNQEAIAKGQIAYDILTRGRELLSQQGYGATQQQVMHKLVFDILRSLPVKQYNYYTLYQLHPDEGNEIYAEFKSRYTPLETAEVEMILEMQRALETEGDAYAFRTTTNEQTGLLSSQLMRAAVADYAVGDTINVRTLLMTLQAPPYNYRVRAVDVAMASGQTSSTRGDASGTTFMEFFVQNKDIMTEMIGNGSGKKLHDKKIGAYALNIDQGDLNDNNKLQLSKTALEANKHETVVIAASQYDPTPLYVAIRVGGGKGQGNKGGRGGGGGGGGGKNQTWKIIRYKQEYLRADTRTSDGRKGQGIRRGLGKHKSNPQPTKRGKFYFVELWPTTQLNIKKREPVSGMAGGTRHGTGKTKKGQGQAYWTKGVSNHAPGMKDKQLLLMGTHKKTGEAVPYRIKFPISDFKLVQHPTAGYKTLMPKRDKLNKKFQAAYVDFITHYGLPKHAPSKDTNNRLIIPKEARKTSPYYLGVRKQIGKK